MDRQATLEQRVAQHYGQNDLERTILSAVAAEGKALDQLTSDDLAPVDEFHTGGRQATVEFAERIRFKPGTHILDVGCGIGGPSRFFAEKCRCLVTGIDITEEYVRTADALARRIGLQERVTYRCASALALPFDAGTFDGAYMMHVGMNIESKPALFAEIRRVLKPGAAFGVYDVVLTGKGEPDFPLPCALDSSIAFFVGMQDYRRALQAAGFEIEQERNRLDVAREFFRQELGRAAGTGGPPALGIHILLKQEAPKIFANTVRQFQDGILAPIEYICRAR